MRGSPGIMLRRIIARSAVVPRYFRAFFLEIPAADFECCAAGRARIRRRFGGLLFQIP